MLGMDVEKAVRDVVEDTDRDGTVIDETAGTARPVDDTADDKTSVVPLDVILVKYFTYAPGHALEFGFDDTAVRAFRDRSGISLGS